MPVTPNHNLYYPSGSDPISPLPPVFAAMQDSVEDALDGMVVSVNGQTGNVALDADDVEARPDTWVPSWSDVTGKPASFAPRQTFYSIAAPATTSAQTASFTAGVVPIPAVNYPRRMTVHVMLAATIAASSDWRIRIGHEAAENTGDPASALMEVELQNTATAAARMSATATASFTLAADASRVVRIQAARASGTMTPLDIYGDTMQVVGIETP